MKNRGLLAGRLVGVIVCLLLGQVTAASMVGTGPESALPPDSEWHELDGGGECWYAFQYAGDGSQIEIRLQVEPHQGLDFEVWTPAGIERRGLGLESDPVGRGSTGSQQDGILVWSGNFRIDGAYFVVVRNLSAGMASYLLEIDGDGVSLALLGPAATPTPEPEQPPAPVSTSTALSGKLVFQTTWGGPFYVIHADGTGLQRLTDGMDPTWSPAGTGPARIAFVRWREPRGVWVVDVTTGEEWRVFDWSETRWPSWSPDGSELLFSRQHGGRLTELEYCFRSFCFTLPPHPHWRLGIVDLGDGAFREPPSSLFSLAPAWSPDGDRIVYADEQGLRVQSEDGEVSYLITDNATDTSPVWSPDGGRVAFTRRQHDHWEIYAVDIDGRNLTRLTDTPRQANDQVAHSAAPAWSPDGQNLAFLSDRSGAWEIWVMQADGRRQRSMFDGVLDHLTLEYAHLSERAISWTR
ncbi:MAG: hypothetical protein PVJ26_10535 [Anaerolineae bacterium]|jgi:hypothetical protein